MSLDPKWVRLSLVDPTLHRINLYSLAATNLIMGTIAQESLMGKYTQQVDGPALGICQIEPFTFNDIVYRRGKYLYLAGYDCVTLEAKEMETDHELSIIICRLKYLDAKEALPDADNILALAQYWKKYYNSPKGGGTAEEFVKNYSLTL